MKLQTYSRFALGVGTLLILAGIFLPSSAVIESMRTTPDLDVTEHLSFGVTLFKLGLVILGLVSIVLGKMPVWHSESKSEKALPDPHRRLYRLILATILLVAAALRMYELDSGLWLDEIYTYVNYANKSFGDILSTYDSENQHLLYSLLAHASFLIFGQSAWSLRLPAVLFGVGSIWALYLLGHQLSSKKEALLAGALLTFSYHHVWFSQNARGYTGLLFWTLLASWFFVRGLQENRPYLWLLYAATASLGVFTHLTMLFVIGGHFLIYVLATFPQNHKPWGERWAGFFLGFFLAGCFTFQIHALVLPEMLSSISQTESVVDVWKNPLWTLLEFLNGLEISFASGIIGGTALLVFGAGFLSFIRGRPLAIYLLVIPPFIGAALVISMGHHLWPRFFFFCIGLGALVIVRGAMVTGQATSRFLGLAPTTFSKLGTALCTGMILVSAISLPLAYGPKQDYEGARDFVESQKEPFDAIVAVGLAGDAYKDFFKTDWEEADTLEALDSIRSRAERTWVLFTLAPVLESTHPQIANSLKHDYEVIKQFHGTLGAGTILVCRSDTPTS